MLTEGKKKTLLKEGSSFKGGTNKKPTSPPPPPAGSPKGQCCKTQKEEMEDLKKSIADLTKRVLWLEERSEYTGNE